MLRCPLLPRLHNPGSLSLPSWSLDHLGDRGTAGTEAEHAIPGEQKEIKKKKRERTSARSVISTDVQLLFPRHHLLQTDSCICWGGTRGAMVEMCKCLFLVVLFFQNWKYKAKKNWGSVSGSDLAQPDGRWVTLCALC